MKLLEQEINTTLGEKQGAAILLFIKREAFADIFCDSTEGDEKAFQSLISDDHDFFLENAVAIEFYDNYFNSALIAEWESRVNLLWRIYQHALGLTNKAKCVNCGAFEVSSPKDTDTISLSWHIDDVKIMDASLSDDDAREILARIKSSHEDTIWVHWDVIQCHIDMFKSEQAENQPVDDLTPCPECGDTELQTIVMPYNDDVTCQECGHQYKETFEK